GLLAVTALLLWVRGRPRVLERCDDGLSGAELLVPGPALLACLCALPCLAVDDAQGLPFRLRLIVHVPLALCAAAVVGHIARRSSSRWWQVVFLAVAAILLVTRPIQSGQGVVEVRPAMVSATLALREVIPADHIAIVPERHIAFMIVWYAERRISLRPEAIPAKRRWRVLPMALMSRQLRAAIDRAQRELPPSLLRPRGVHPRHRHGLVAMPEATWQWIVRQLPSDQRALYKSWIAI
ncbi:MAG: hypothetical protein AAGC55_27115, partial [Myxococcota bacterium]